MDEKYYIIVVLICFYLMDSNVKHLFTFLLIICISFLETCLFRSSAPFVVVVHIKFCDFFVYFGLDPLSGVLPHSVHIL